MSETIDGVPNRIEQQILDVERQIEEEKIILQGLEQNLRVLRGACPPRRANEFIKRYLEEHGAAPRERIVQAAIDAGVSAGSRAHQRILMSLSALVNRGGLVERDGVIDIKKRSAKT